MMMKTKTVFLTALGTLAMFFAAGQQASADTKVTVKNNDSVWAIAQHYHTTVDKIAKANHLKNASMIMNGQKLVIPTRDKDAKAPVEKHTVRRATVKVEKHTVKKHTAAKKTTGVINGGISPMSVEAFKQAGRVSDSGYTFTYYSPDGSNTYGLGAYTSDGTYTLNKRDKDGYLILASDKPFGTKIMTPVGLGVVHDRGTFGNHIDVVI